MKLANIPERFCWTKFGTEAGETIDRILARKERERVVNGGVFLWGIGNSVAPGIRALVQMESSPITIFSPMRTKPKAIDSAPSIVVAWRNARTLNGINWTIPRGSTVFSRGGTAIGSTKRTHYALVCHSDGPISAAHLPDQIRFGELVNLVSGSPLGFSQVTSVVQREHNDSNDGPAYPIGFYASLIYPYFVELSYPAIVSGERTKQPWEESEIEAPQYAPGFE